ncbi:MAG: hypothetical protein E7356_01805 [Clostridiales bacterium]|nr:hypothetical protein [Clostridiales bacterium]
MKNSKDEIVRGENILVDSLTKKSGLLRTKTNIMFIISILLVCICVVVLTVIVESNINGIAPIKEIVEAINYKYVWLIVALWMIILVVSSFSDYLHIYNRTKKRKYLSVLIANIRYEFEKNVSIYGANSKPAYFGWLNSRGVDNKVIVESVYSKELCEKIAKIIVSFVVFILSFIFIFEFLPAWLLIVAGAVLLTSLVLLIFILSFNFNKTWYIGLVGKFSKMLYRLKLVKNVDNVYNALVQKISTYNSLFKANKLTIILRIVSAVIEELLKILIVYIVVCMLGIGGVEVLLQTALSVVVMDLIINILPMPKGIGVYELLFGITLAKVFPLGYWVWGLLTIRIIDYCAIGVVYIMTLLLSSRKNKIKSDGVQV